MNEFNSQGLRAGRWSGILRGDSAPGRVVVTNHAEIIAHARCEAVSEGVWQVEVDLPSSVLADGIYSLVLIADDGADDEPVRPGAIRLATLPLMAGRVMADDLLAEISHLRAELELLKREFRRFASEA